MKAKKEHFFAGAFFGILGVLVWNFTLGKPYGIDGLIAGIFCNLIAFFGSFVLIKRGEGSGEEIS